MTDGVAARVGLWAALVGAVGLRLALSGPLWTPDIADPDGYLGLARSVARGEGYTIAGRPTAYRPPLYPLLLTPIVGLVPARIVGGAVAVLHAVLGALTVVLTWATARRWGFGPRRSAAAAWIVALDPVLVAQSRVVMTETLSAMLTAAALFALSGPRTCRAAVLGGLAFGLGSLCRPSLLPAAVLTAAAWALAAAGPLRRRAACAGIMAVATAVVLAPWAIRNSAVIGSTIWTTSHGGYTAALANNDAYYDAVVRDGAGSWTGRSHQLWTAEALRRTGGMSEPEADRAFAAEAIRTARRRPGDFVRAAVGRVGRFFAVAPSADAYGPGVRAAAALWTVPLWIAFVLGLARAESWRIPRVAAPILVGSLAVVHVLYWTDVRMRAPIIPALALIAAGASFRARPANEKKSEKCGFPGVQKAASG